MTMLNMDFCFRLVLLPAEDSVDINIYIYLRLKYIMLVLKLSTKYIQLS